MTATLSTRMEIEALGPGDVELAVEYTYEGRPRELVVGCCLADINGVELEVWHMLTKLQREIVEERCITDYHDRMAGALYEARVIDDGVVYE